jgi:hypothetical protein
MRSTPRKVPHVAALMRATAEAYFCSIGAALDSLPRKLAGEGEEGALV